MATRSQALKPAGKLVLLQCYPGRRQPGSHCGVHRPYGSNSIRRVKTLLLCLAVGPWGCLSPAGACHSGSSQQQGLF